MNKLNDAVTTASNSFEDKDNKFYSSIKSQQMLIKDKVVIDAYRKAVEFNRHRIVVSTTVNCTYKYASFVYCSQILTTILTDLW